MKCNYHTHSIFCDGKEPIATFVERASALHFDHLGFSSHAPVANDNNFGIKEDRIPVYCDTIHALQAATPVILFAGLECDFIPTLTQPFVHYSETYHLDYIIGGVHLVKDPHSQALWFIDGSKRETYDAGLFQLFDNDIKKAVTTYWEQVFCMLETEKLDIVAHIDKIKMHNQSRFFNEKEKWYLQLVDHAIELVAKQNVIMELNSRGIYKGRCPDFYPSDYILQKAAQRHIPFIISSDAHKSEELDKQYDEAVAKLKSFHIDRLVCFNNHKWKEYAI